MLWGEKEEEEEEIIRRKPAMAEFEKQLKSRAKELKHMWMKGVKVVGDSCKKGWQKVKSIRR